MSIAEEVRRVLLEHPEILVEVLTARPHIVYEALAKLLPWERLLREVEEIKNNMATKRELEEIRNTMATKDDLKQLAAKEELQKLEKRLEEVESRMATKEDLKALATKEELRAEIRKLSIQIMALGARWGVWSEEAFREGVRELFREAGYVVERWTYFDEKGQVYGYPSELELDVVMRDGVVVVVEIASAVRRGDLPYVKRKAELYEKVSGRRVERVILVSPFIHDKNPDFVRALARSLGIDIVSPAEQVEPRASG
ncbi:MAG: DUF3782 domain-containing protein [Thermoproteus sp.]